MYNLIFLVVVPLVLLVLFTFSNINASVFNLFFGDAQKLIGFITALLTYIYVVLTGRMVRQMKETSEEESRPFIVPDIDFENQIGHFEVKNIGKLPARDLKVSITPDLIGVGGWNISQTLFSKPIALVPPGKVIRTVVNTGVEMLKDSYPKQYEITLEYNWGKNKTATENNVVDFSYRKGIIYVNNKGLDEIAKSLEQLTKDFSSVVKWDGIHIKTTEDIERESREGEQFYKEAEKVFEQLKDK